MTLESWKDRATYFDYQGYNIAYWYDGDFDNETILLIHGFPTASWDWHKIWQTTSESHSVFALDMIGFGFSDKPKKYPYSIIDQADIHEQVLDAKEIRKVHVLAHDYGDTVAQELIARHQTRILNGEEGLEIASVCFLNGGLFPETHQPRLIQKLLISPIGSFLSPFLNKEKLRKNLNDIFGKNTQPSATEIDEFYSLIEFNNGKAVMHKLIRYMSERRTYRERWVAGLVDASFPIRLINGSVDPVSGSHMVARYREVVNHPDVIPLDGIGHYPQTEAPELVLFHYLDFLNSLTSQSV